MSDDLNDLYQQVILDHNNSPRNFCKLENANRVAEGYNPLCGDKVTVYLVVEGNIIRDISFQGSGCAISKASASMMTAYLKGKTVEEAHQIFENFQQMIKTGKSDSEEVGKLAVFAGVHKFPARVKCAILPWHAIMNGIDGKSDIASTE